MIYKGEELSNYPICDTDIWVDVILAKLDDELIGKYEKIVVADVVEKEILNFGKNPYFKVIAKKYEVLKKNEKIVVIEHSDIEEEDKRFLEKQLVECDDRFKTGLEDSPHEKHKGEIVSAIYAEYFECPFLKSNDGAFHEGNMGRVAFPDLVVKNREDMLRDLTDERCRHEYRQAIIDNRAFMNEGSRIYEEEKNTIVTEVQVQNLLLKLRGMH